MTPEPPAPTYAPTRRAGLEVTTADLAGWTAVGLAFFLALGAATLLWRSLAGALAGPLQMATVLAAALPLAVLVAAARLVMGLPTRYGRPPAYGWLAPGVLSLAMVGFAVALSLPGTSAPGLAVLWAVVAAEELWAWRPAAWRGRRRSTRRAPQAPRQPRIDAVEPAASHAAPVPVAAEPPAEEVTQQLTRLQTADGTETLAGWLRVGFAPGQRVANVHVAFCPPFGRTPRARLEQLEGPAARIKTGQVLPYGARFDLKLSGAAEEPATVLLRFAAEARPAAEGSVE